MIVRRDNFIRSSSWSSPSSSSFSSTSSPYPACANPHRLPSSPYHPPSSSSNTAAGRCHSPNRDSRMRPRRFPLVLITTTASFLLLALLLNNLPSATVATESYAQTNAHTQTHTQSQSQSQARIPLHRPPLGRKGGDGHASSSRVQPDAAHASPKTATKSAAKGK